jgi:hypothetical protein
MRASYWRDAASVVDWHGKYVVMHEMKGKSPNHHRTLVYGIVCDPRSQRFVCPGVVLERSERFAV